MKGAPIDGVAPPRGLRRWDPRWIPPWGHEAREGCDEDDGDDGDDDHGGHDDGGDGHDVLQADLPYEP
eukprot:9282276-Pyramimonas_sp.AAC.1